MFNLFEQDVADIFKEAGIQKEQAPEMWEEAKNILAEKMAILSVTMGLSFKRVELFDEQKKSLIEDMKKMKDEGHLR